MKRLITGYAGFIGSNLTRKILKESEPGDITIGLDCFTYAARPEWVEKYLRTHAADFISVECDITSHEGIEYWIKEYQPDEVYHLAAESHVCKSIEGPRAFAETNFMGTFNLLEALRKIDFKGRLVHISTDETFGELDLGQDPFHEKTLCEPRSPYSASKCASDLMVQAYVHTYGLDACITRCTNNYGPNQHLEKLIPKAITQFLKGEAMTLYGSGCHMRDWIYVDDHCEALQAVMHKGERGEIYCIGSGLELANMDVVSEVIAAMRDGTSREFELVFTNGRPTDDKRYAVSVSKIMQLGWVPQRSPEYFRERLKETIQWYKENQ